MAACLLTSALSSDHLNLEHLVLKMCTLPMREIAIVTSELCYDLWLDLWSRLFKLQGFGLM